MNLKTKINLAIIVFIIFTILVISFLIYPLFSEIKKGMEGIVSKKQKIAELETKIESLEKFRTYYQKEKENLEKINTLFIEDPKMPLGFIDFVKQISTDSQVELDIAFGENQKKEEDPWFSISVQITAEGSFPNFLKFLEKLESSDYLIEIENLNIRKLTEGELREKELEEFSLDGIKSTLSIKVYTK